MWTAIEWVDYIINNEITIRKWEDHWYIEIQAIDNDNRIALIIGAEGKGLRNLTKKNVDELVKIDINPKWKIRALKDLIKLSSGNGLTQDKFRKGSYDVFGGNGIVGKHNQYFLEKPTIVIGRVGAYCGSIHITSPKSWITDNGLYIKEFSEDIDLNFLLLIFL